MRWSMPAPVCAADGNTLPILPNEIYLLIIDLVHYAIDWDEDDRRRSLSNLALSCVLFRGFIVPRIFKSLHFNGGQEDTELRSAVNSSAFCRVLNSGKEPAISLAQYVEECILVNWNIRAGKPSFNAAFMNMYCRAFLRMPNLHKLSLSHVVIDAHLLKTIRKLKSLRSLTLNAIDFSRDHVAERLFQKMPPITSLRLESLNSGDESIVARVVNVIDLQILSAAKYTQVLPLLPHTPALVELYLLSVESTTALWDAMSCLKALTTLEMKYVIVRRDTPSHQLSASSLPSLRHLKAPPSFSSIVSNRLLSSINLMDGIQFDQTNKITHLSSQIAEISKDFTRSSAGLTSLLIPFEFYPIGAFCEKFPDLENLSIMIDHPNFNPNACQLNSDYDGCRRIKSFTHNVTTKWPPAPSVKSLKLSTVGTVPFGRQKKYLYDLELQYNLIPQIVAAFPNVHKVQFFDYLEWTREFYGEKWTGYIPFEFHGRIRLQLNVYNYVGKDVDGLLLPFLTFDAPK